MLKYLRDKKNLKGEKMNEKLMKLNCMNYIVEDYESHYYLQCGLRSLFNFSKTNKIDFKGLCLTMLNKGYLVLDDDETQISMI